MSYRNGYDYIVAKTHDTKPRTCLICKAKMILEEGVKGPTGFAAAMMKIDSVHNTFTCPNNPEKWHEFAGELLSELEGTISPSVRKLIEYDLNLVLREKQFYKGVI